MTTTLDINLKDLDVLVVDDDAITALQIVRILSEHGARVDAASNGDEALARFEEKRHPVIVTDILMPGMDGIELVERVRQLDKNTQAIAVSASGNVEHLVSAIELGFNDYFLKPLKYEKLLWAVKRCADSNVTRQQLENEREKFRSVVECMGEGVTIKDPEYRILYQNRAMTEMFGDRIGSACYEIFGRNTPCQDCPTIHALKDGHTHSARLQYQLDGSVIHFESNVSLLRDSTGTVTGTVEIIRDISEKVRTEDLVHNIARGISSKIGSEYLVSLACYLTEALQMDYAIVGELTDDGTRIQSLAFSHKGTAAEAFSYALDGTPCARALSHGLQVFPENVADLFPDDTDLRTLSIESYCGAPLINSRGAATGLLCTFHTSPIEKPELVSDIIRIFASRAAAELERLKNEQTIRDMAFQDPLTGLANRRLFQDRLEQTIAKSRRYEMKFGLLTLDLDYFKEINDTFGHEAGDQVLLEAAERIKACCKRDLDTISRQGGDEFCIIITDCDGRGQLTVIAEKLLAQFARPFHLSGSLVEVTTSIGISIFPDNGLIMKELEIASDRAMYAAKKAGRNGYRFWEPQQNSAQ